jgi:FixJ family two-component response regulator
LDLSAEDGAFMKPASASDQPDSLGDQPSAPLDCVFVVDDDDSVRRSLVRLIRSAGYEVIAYKSAEALLAEPDLKRGACLVLDLRLPAMSGLELQELLTRSGRSLPIIFISGHGDVPTTVRAMRGGAVDFLQKPFNERDLVQAIERARSHAREGSVERAELDVLRTRAETLTPRERQVMDLVVAGLPNKLVGATLGASEKTVKIHRARVMRKMGAGSLPDLVRMAGKLAPRH